MSHHSKSDDYPDWDNEGDLGPEYWEKYMGGPDDSVWEDYEKRLWEDYQQLESWGDEDLWIDDDTEASSFQADADRPEENREPVGTMEDRPLPEATRVLRWLVRSPLPLWIAEMTAFRIMRGQLVRLPNGDFMDVLDFLQYYGLTDGAVVDDWHVVQSYATVEDREQLLFFRVAHFF